MADANDTHASPREYKRHQRYSRFSRLNHSKQELSFLTTEATRLSVTTAQIFAALDSYTADQIRAATSASQLGI
jgi:hypothetical protein